MIPHQPYEGLYIHIPFCVKRCAYCDFTTRAVASTSVEIDEYIESLCREIRSHSKRSELGSIKTVYLGGGTPSFIGLNRLSMLLYTLSVSLHLEPWVECTMEANPESLTPPMVRDIWALGVNRLSLGVQSFNDHLLQVLGRPHNAKDARAAISCAQERFENISIDLICGIPGQTLDQFKEDIDQALHAGVTHISIYPLTIEKHTPFYNQVISGVIDEPDEDLQADMMDAAACLLHRAGFARYEVASYARPGFESKHNSLYWAGKPYLGVGTSAVTMTQNETRRIRTQDGQVVDDLDQYQMAAEDLMLAMRRVQGVSVEQVYHLTKHLPELPQVLIDLQKRSLIDLHQGRYVPTKLGWLCGNELYGTLLNLAP